MSETDIVTDIRLALSHGGVRLFRNNVGVLQDARGNYVTYGLGVGTSDLIGYVSRVVSLADLGKRIAIFTACEVKRPKGRTTDEQAAFIRTVREAGGIAGVAHSVDEALTLLTI